MENIKLTIDNREVEVPKGTTILDAAKSMGIRIPTLCHMKLEDLHYDPVLDEGLKRDRRLPYLCSGN